MTLKELLERIHTLLEEDDIPEDTEVTINLWDSPYDGQEESIDEITFGHDQIELNHYYYDDEDYA